VGNFDFKDVARQCLFSAKTILSDWFPHGTIRGNEFCIGSLQGEKGESLKVNLLTGVWKDFASLDKGGGDLISLYAAIHSVNQFQAAKQIYVNYLGGEIEVEREIKNKFLVPPKGSFPDFGNSAPEDVWTYKTKSGEDWFHIAKYLMPKGKKLFVPFTWNGKEWIKKQPPKPRPLYNLHLISNSAKPILLVEGEKACDAANKIQDDYVAVTWPGGSSAVHEVNFDPIIGRKILLWPDQDEPGHLAMDKVMEIIGHRSKFCKINTSSFASGWDAFDIMEEGIEFKSLTKIDLEIQSPNFSDQETGKPSQKYEDFKEFMDFTHPSARKCPLASMVFTKDADRFKGWDPIDNHKDAMESIARDAGIDHKVVRSHLARWINEKPPQLLIDIDKWDGFDHIKDALDRITVTNIEHKFFVELMKEWFSNIILRFKSSRHQNRMPIFRGKQEIGKDFAIRSMLSGLEHYASEIDFEQNSKTELYRVISGLLVGIIPEFDETNSSMISRIKSAVTTEGAVVRALYKNAGMAQQIRCSFISASNFKDVLRDPTGNRRFLLFDIERIEHTFEMVSGSQILAQAKSLAENGYQSSLEAKAAMREILALETPDTVDDLMIEEVQNMLQEKQRFSIVGGGPNRLRWFQIAEDVERIARKYRIGIRRAQSIIKRAGFRGEDNSGKFYSAVALNKASEPIFEHQNLLSDALRRSNSKLQ
jgi:hypothetical protein